MKISVIVGFRNRDLSRVKRHLDSFLNQTYNNFEVVFIDYGSEHLISQEIKILISKYPFCKLIYNYTKGMPWNRSHALNSGLRLATGENILFGDIDLIYSDNFLKNLIDNKKSNTQIFQQVYWLPKNFTDWHNLKLNIENLNISDSGSKGGVHFIEKKKLVEIGGYDEFYCFWGHEDNDLFIRLDNLGLKTTWINPKTSPVYHQWHPTATSETKNFMPDRWWDLMTIYLNVNKDIPFRNKLGWGKIFSIDDRPTLTCKNVVKNQVGEIKNSFDKAREFRLILENIRLLEKNQCLEIIVNEDINKQSLSLFQKVGRKMVCILINFFKLPYKIVTGEYLRSLELNRFDSKSDIFYMVWQLVMLKEVGDYAILEGEPNLIIRVTNKNT